MGGNVCSGPLDQRRSVRSGERQRPDVASTPASGQRRCAGHLAILEAYLSGDADAARAAVRTHLQTPWLFVLERISEGG